MEKIKIFEAEYKFMNIIWDNEPVGSPELVMLANEQLGWKKSTTYTVLRRLSERGAIENNNTVVTSLVTREEVMYMESQEHINKIYEGSMKLFFSTFLKKEKLSDDELDELKNIIDKYKGE